MRLELQLIDRDTGTWMINGRLFETSGGLYVAMDIALAYANNTNNKNNTNNTNDTTLDNLPYEKHQWSYNKTTNTYEMDLTNS